MSEILTLIGERRSVRGPSIRAPGIDVGPDADPRSRALVADGP